MMAFLPTGAAMPILPITLLLLAPLARGVEVTPRPPPHPPAGLFHLPGPGRGQPQGPPASGHRGRCQESHRRRQARRERTVAARLVVPRETPHAAREGDAPAAGQRE